MSDIKFDIMRRSAIKAEQSSVVSELDTIMQAYVDSGLYTKEQLAEMRKREANKLANQRQTKKIEEEQQKLEKKPKPKAEPKRDTSQLYENNNPLYNSFRPDVTLNDKGNTFFDIEEKEAKGRLKSKLKNTNLEIEETNVTVGYDRGGTEDPSDDVTSDIREGINIFTASGDEGISYDAIKITNPTTGEELLLELDQGGFIGHGTDQEASKIRSYNKLANFLDANLSDDEKEILLQNSEDAAEILRLTEENHLEPTEEEYIEKIQEKELTSTDIFNEKTVRDTNPAAASSEKTLEFGGYEDDIEEARKQLIIERKNAAAVSSIAYEDPTIDEIKEKALFNLQQDERKNTRKVKYDKYLNELDKFSRGIGSDLFSMDELAEEQGIKKYDRSKDGKYSVGLSKEYSDFVEKTKDQFREKYYSLKQANADEEANAVLEYKKNELALQNSINRLEKTDSYRRFNETNALINNLKHKYPKAEKEVQLENGKIIPLDIWEQHMRDQAQMSLTFKEVEEAMKAADESIKVIKDRSFQWDMIKRNYNDFERTQEVLGYGFANLGATAIYGIPKFLSFGHTGGDDDIIKWKEVVAKNRQSFRKDVEWDRAFEDGNFGRFMGQSVVDQIPIYATLATGNLGLGILGASVFGDKWADMTMEERLSGDFTSKTEKWFTSLGYAASEVVLDYAITVPIMRNAKLSMMGGKGKALLNNSSNAFFKKYTARNLVYSPLLEGVSEGSTQVAQNMIDGRPLSEGLDHAAFLGLSMGLGMGGSSFAVGAINSQFSDQAQFEPVRENITRMQALAETNAELKLYKNEEGVDTKKAEQEIKDNEALIEKLGNQNMEIINKIYPDIRSLTRKAYEEFVNNEQGMEVLKVEAQKIIDGSLPESQKQKQLSVLLAAFNARKQAAKEFKDLDAFGSRWPLVQNDTSEEGKKKYNDLIEKAKEKLKEEGNLKPTDENIDEAAKDIWAREEVRKSNDSYKRTNFSKNYESVEEIEDGVNYITKQIQEEIDFYNEKLNEGVEEVVNPINGKKVKIKDLIDSLVDERKTYVSAIKTGRTYGLTRIDTRTAESKSFSIVASQAKAERFETRVHEGGHQVFWDALQAAGNDPIFEPMAQQILDWTQKNDESMYKRILLATDMGRQGAAEIVSVFMEEAGDSNFDTQPKKNLANLWGLMANKTMFDLTGETFEFAGEKNAIKFLVGISKKIKEGKLTKKNIRDIRKSELLRSFITEKSVEKQTGQFSQDASNNVQNIYDTRGVDGAFDIIEQFKPITTRIANRYRDVPGYNQELVVSEIEIGERGILDLIRSYKPESGVPLAAYINTYLPSRSIEAANRVLKEQFTEDITERVDIAAEDVDVDTKPVRKKKKVVIADRLGVNKKVDSAIRRILPDLNIEKLNFKNLKNKIPEITGKLFGIDALKFIPTIVKDGKTIKNKKYLANITKSELQSSQMFINKNADLLIQMLPEGATASGTATGVPNSLLEAFYTKTDRAKMAKTGSGAGLPIQVKNKNITPKKFLETFGIIDGTPVRTDRNTSARVLALANLTGKIITNQAVRVRLAEGDAKAKEAADKLRDGISEAMFSSDFGMYTLGTLSKRYGISLTPLGTVKKPGKDKLYDSQRLVDEIFEFTGETYYEAGTRVINTFIESHPEFRNLIRKTMTGGFKAGFFKTVGEFDKVINSTDVVQKDYTRDQYNESNRLTRSFVDRTKTKNFKTEQDGKLPMLLDFFLAVESHLKKYPHDVWMFEEFLKDTGKQQNTLTRILAPITAYPINEQGNPIYNLAVVEEHTNPQNQIGKALLAAANTGNVKDMWKAIGKSYMQLSLLKTDDIKINDAGYARSMPDVYFDEILPRLLDGSLKLPDGLVSVIRLTESGVDLNGYYLIDQKQTIAEFFGVEGMSVEMQKDLVKKQLTGEVDAMFSRDFSGIGLNPVTQQDKQLNKAVLKARSGQYSQDTTGITILDFDDTLATTKSLVKFTTPDGKTGTLNAEQYASTYVDLLDQGYVFDFSEFNKVVKGKIAPLFQKALKLQKKFGPENMFVLTARPPAAQKAIFDFLKANGLNIPIKNITGLGNSTAEAKALWVADKVAEGYNDFYFADDALQNVQAVDNILEQFDVKRKVQQAKLMFSRDMDTSFNDILEQVTGIDSKKEFSAAQAKLRGKSSKYKSIIPPSAQDFMGLIYNFLGKGKKGDADFAFFKKALVDPFARGVNELNTSRQRAANDLENLNKKLPEVKKKLYKKVKGTDYTNDQAMRVYLWNKAGFEVPGLSKRDLKTLVETVENDSKLKAYAEAVSLISKQENVYREPKEYWLAENITSDLLDDGAVGDARSTFLGEWIENKNIIFSPKNLNKIEAVYGSRFREALEDILYAMETGRSRPRGGGRLVNAYTNWVNNSVGAIMFFNMRSALLQTISATNYINWSDNNPLKAAQAFANQPQYWKDFAFIFNSDYLKQRRTGNRRGINEQELSAAVAGSDNKAKAAIAWLLSKGFLPTQIADSFAIASGGATFYRNRIKKYLKEGLTQEQAEKKAFLDFQEITEVSQQSARPDMISQQQRSPLGRLILAFANTPMQYARIMNKSARDLVNGRGDSKTHISKIVYYGFIQSIIFSALQSALFASLGDEDEEDFNKKKERILNQIGDSVLTGIGFGGKAIITVKNTIITFLDQRDRGFRADHAYTLLQLLSFSPPIGSKLRKVYSSIKTDQYNKDVYMKRGFTLDNPIWQAIGNVVEGVTNLPLGRMSNKMLNIDNALDESNKWWQRAALLLGWNTWDLGIRDPDIEEIKKDIKKDKESKKKTKQTVNKENINKKKQEQEKKEGKTVMCAAISKSGNRCKTKVEPGSSYCTIHAKVKQNKTGKKTQCKKVKKGGKRCKMQTSSASGYCYYHD